MASFFESAFRFEGACAMVRLFTPRFSMLAIRIKRLVVTIHTIEPAYCMLVAQPVGTSSPIPHTEILCKQIPCQGQRTFHIYWLLARD